MAQHRLREPCLVAGSGQQRQFDGRTVFLHLYRLKPDVERPFAKQYLHRRAEVLPRHVVDIGADLKDLAAYGAAVHDRSLLCSPPLFYNKTPPAAYGGKAARRNSPRHPARQARFRRLRRAGDIIRPSPYRAAQRRMCFSLRCG